MLKQLVLGAAVWASVMANAQEWYPFTATGNPEPGELGMADWLDKPAGAHGRVTRKGDMLMYNGAPLKLWGLNLCFNACVPEKSMADKRAAFYPKYGINTVRLHKYTESDYISPQSVTEFQPDAIDRMDYQVAKFKEAGIYVTLSAHFGSLRVAPGDRKFVPYIDEFGSFEKPDARGNLPKTLTLAHSALFYSPELQDLHIAQMVNLLKHKNAYTGMTYAEDPAIAFIEVINEQSAMFHTSMQPLQRYPTIRKMVGERFTEWLLKKYQSEQGLIQAWGERALTEPVESFNEPQSVAQKNILPLGNPWYWDPANLHTSQAFRKQRFLDTLEFLTMLQNETYDRYVKAMREAGYEGEILGSNWQAGVAYSHYANLWTDWRVGTIDRHNYFGGGGRNNGPFNNGSMLQRPGGGLLSSGMQQVADRPFMLSEWIHVFPNEYGVEGPAILGAYGMGLQGWDVSYMFQNRDTGTFSNVVGRDQWDVTAPQVLGIFPAVARQVYRDDVKESEVVATRKVHVPSLFEGKLALDETVKQGYDDKEFDSKVVPASALAAVRSVVEFVEKPTASEPLDINKFTKDGWIVSSNGQLAWQPGKNKHDGVMTINTPGTQAVVGFAEGQTLKMADLSIAPKSRYAAIYVSAPGKDQKIAGARKLLVSAIARARNTGMKLNPAEDQILDRGKAPITLEPVVATIRMADNRPTRVVLLDHDGLRTDKTLEVSNGVIELDTGRDRTPYYLIEFAE